MFKNYIKIALRALVRNKLYTFINLAGLAIGIATTIFIMLFVIDELSYDKFHEKHEQIYRISTKFNISGKEEHAALTSPPQAPTIKQDYPEVLEFVRLQPFFNKVMIEYDGSQFYEEKGFFADSTLFSVFDFELISGDPDKALAEPNTVVLTESTARKFFSDEDPIGKVLTMDFPFNKSFMVSGVMKDVPSNSHLDFNMLLSLQTIAAVAGPQFEKGWFSYQLYSYLLLPENYDKAKLEAKFPEFYDKYIAEIGKKVNTTVDFELQPLSDLHLESHLEWEPGPTGNKKYIYIFLAVAFFILIIACINYMNLATALSESRYKEIGLRKVFGGVRTQLIIQFLVQSFILTLLGLFFALVLVELLLPVFNEFTGKSISTGFFLNSNMLLIMLYIVILVGLFAGLYPALYLSKFNPIETLRQKFKTGKRSLLLREVLVVFQFAISVVMIVVTIVVFAQLDYMQNKDLGFNKDRIAVVELQDTSLINRFEMIKSELTKLDEVEAVATTVSVPGGMIPKQLLKAEDNGKMLDMGPDIVLVDYDYIDMMEINVQEGRKFDRSMGTDVDQGFIVNEKFVEKMGWKEPLGQKMQWGMKQDGSFVKDGKVIGVVSNFNVSTLKEDVSPMAMMLTKNGGNHMLVRMKPGNIESGLAKIEAMMQELDPAHPFEYFFLDEYINRQYVAEAKVGKLFTFFALISIFIACLGLFGLASFSVAKRTKEIGIRKVVGASVGNIVVMINRDFLKLVFISFVIAFPIAYYAMDKWLQEFAYRVTISWEPFAIAMAAAILIAIITISFQAIRAGISNPVRSLRYE